MRRVALAVSGVVCATFGGCKKPVSFPVAPVLLSAAEDGTMKGWDVDGDGAADFFSFANAEGRVDRIGFHPAGGQAPTEMVSLDDMDVGQCRHVVIILDGFGYDLIRKYREDGGLRLLHPPSRVIAPYPTLTDLAMEDLFAHVPCAGFEAEYFDHEANKIAGGSWAYLAGKNQPYNELLDYRANLIWDAVGYLWPVQVFGKEINDAMKVFRKEDKPEVRMYFVSTAGVGTTRGAEGQREALPKVEQLVHQILWETRGRVKFTILSDHGHSYTQAKRIPLEKHLKERGWRLRDSLRDDRDAVYIRFGLETYASFATRSPAALAADLIDAEGVELASYADGETAVVLAPGGAKAVIHRRGDRYRYEVVQGDPLKLLDPMAGLTPDADGYCGADDLLAATAEHEYPAPLQRVHRAHFDLAENPPDVILSLANEYYSGAKSFAGSVKVASTHGGLNLTNSSAFIMSSIGPLPPILRSADIPKALSDLLGVPWPARN